MKRTQEQIEAEIAEYRKIIADARDEIKRLTAEAGALAVTEQRARLKRRKYAWYCANGQRIPYGTKVTIEKVNRKWVVIDAGKYGRWNVLPMTLASHKPSESEIDTNVTFTKILQGAGL